MGTRRSSRKKLYEMPVHRRKELVKAKVVKEAREELGTRVVVKSGDTVRVMRGEFKGKEGKVVEVNRKEGTLAIEGVQRKNSQGKDVYIPVHASNVMVVKR